MPNVQALFCYWLTTNMCSLVQTLGGFSLSLFVGCCIGSHHTWSFSGMTLLPCLMSLSQVEPISVHFHVFFGVLLKSFKVVMGFYL
jgi:ABC-type nitrate/sulfonate/bicarbonate transport system permease component